MESLELNDDVAEGHGMECNGMLSWPHIPTVSFILTHARILNGRNLEPPLFLEGARTVPGYL